MAIGVTQRFLPAQSDPVRDARNSQTAVLGGVVRELPPHWTTADGTKPRGIDGSNYSVGSLTIVAPFQIQIEQIYKGTLPGPRTTVLQPGGRVGQDWIEVVDGLPELKAGQRYVLYLQREAKFGGVVASFLTSRYLVDATGQANGFTASFSLEEIARAVK